MDKRIILGGAGVLAIIAAIAGAQMFPSNEKIPDDLVTEADDNPFSGLGELIDEAPGIEMTEEQQKAEEEFLDMSHGDDGGEDLPDGPEGFENVPYQSCDKAPETLTDEYRRGIPESAATRMIYSFLMFQNVLDTQDCTCTGKVPAFEGVQQIKDALAEEHGEDWDRLRWAAHYDTKAGELKRKVEAFCEGEF